MGLAKQLRKLADHIDPAHAAARRDDVPPRLHHAFQRLHRDLGIRTVLDVGANRGEFARMAATCFPHAAIHAFEPLQTCIAPLESIAARFPTIHIHRTAIGDDRGEVEIFESDFTAASSVLPMMDRNRQLWPQASAGHTVKAPIDTIDALAERLAFDAPIFLKLDVQGYEMHALRGAERTLSRTGAVLTEALFEPLYEGQPTFRTLVDHLGERGLEFVEFVEEARRPPDFRMLYADALFVRR